jgi:chromatin remodeling complex protein RSC6
MPRKATTKKTQNVEEKTSTLPQVPVQESPVTVVQQPVQAPVPTPAPVQDSTQVSDSTLTTELDGKKPSTRRVHTNETIEREFNEIVTTIEEEIKKIRESNSKFKGVKFLRTLNKRVKVLKKHALRVSKTKTTNRSNNTNSGFLKPVQISKDLAKFTGWDQSQLRSRVDVTKYICNYIKEKGLQDPTDKRNIRVDEDQNLKKLLKFDSRGDKKPLTYYRLQTYLKTHFSTPVEDK